MPNFEHLRLKDLICKFRLSVENILSVRSLSGMKGAGEKLQKIYDFLVLSEEPFERQQDDLNRLFKSFNYAAVVVNGAVAKGGLTAADSNAIFETLTVLSSLCLVLENSLTE